MPRFALAHHHSPGLFFHRGGGARVLRHRIEAGGLAAAAGAAIARPMGDLLVAAGLAVGQLGFSSSCSRLGSATYVPGGHLESKSF